MRPPRQAPHQGWLPYTLRWDLEALESRYPHGFTIAASGDFDGRGVWTFAQDGRFVDVTYAWRLAAPRAQMSAPVDRCRAAVTFPAAT